MKKKYYFILLILSSISCSKSVKVYQINDSVEHIKLKLYSDSTFTKTVEEVESSNKYSGIWKSNFKNDSTFITITTKKGYNILTYTPVDNYKIVNGSAINVKNIITNKFKLDFLNEILSDTTNLKIID